MRVIAVPVLLLSYACANEDVTAPVPSQDLASAELPAPVGAPAAAPPAPTPSSTSTASGENPAPPVVPDPGPAPTATCTITKDADGFFTRNSGLGDYVAYVPASYSPSKPMRVIVGMHGCGDDMANFAHWGMNPYDLRSTQDHIGISLGSETGSNKCWNKGGDDAKVMAAVDDLAKCFWVHRAKIVVAGFSSGGELAYRVGMMSADKFAGILIEHSALYAAGGTEDTLLANAAWKLPIRHRAATSDTVFPIANVKTDWTTITNAGFPLTTSEVAGTHDGTSTDWASWLIPASATWTLPAH